MSKSQTMHQCSKCQFRTATWQGKCPSCNEWDTLQLVKTDKLQVTSGVASTPLDLSGIVDNQHARIVSGISEFDEVLGGGIVPGSLVLLGGDPGIGKSTLALQLCMKNAPQNVLYVSGEESAGQIKLRASRISKNHQLQVLAETDLSVVLATVAEIRPDLVVVDSIQTLYTAEASGVAGGVAQVTNAVQKIMQLAKSQNISFIIIGHVTKEGYLAGPKTLEHMVDTVLYLEGERFAAFRILRCVKNRFGTTNEVGVFEMQGAGLIEVKNPSQLFLGEDSIKASGNIITSVLEGSRAILLEIQALTSTTNFGYPKRTTSGYDNNRLQLITAILSKRAGMNLSNQDIYINVVGGLKIEEPAADLAVALSVISSIKDQVIEDTVVVGELGLSGEVRFVPNLEKRIREAEKLGFKRIICPKSKISLSGKIKVAQIKTLSDAVKAL